MSLRQEVEAIRKSVGNSRRDHLSVVRVSGSGAFALVDATSPAPLFLREGQGRHTLLLGEDAGPLADLLILCEEDGFLLIADGLSEAELGSHLQARRAELPGVEVDIIGLGATHVLFGCDGPYAWELVSRILGPAVLGMPYLTLLACQDEILCIRGGRTGEYGYDLLVPRARAAELAAELASTGQELETRAVSLAALDHCALENWHFSPRNLGRRKTQFLPVLTPIELQLQWRVAYDRRFLGSEALAARRAARSGYRVACVSTAADIDTNMNMSMNMKEGAPILLHGHPVGQVLTAVQSFFRQEDVGAALLPDVLAHPGTEGLAVLTADGPVALRTHAPPLLNNRSLFVVPHRHSYASRRDDQFPPLVTP